MGLLATDKDEGAKRSTEYCADRADERSREYV